MSFINECQGAWNEPWGTAIEDFKDLSRLQQFGIVCATGLAAIVVPILSIPLAVVTFRSLVNRCTDQNEDRIELQKKADKDKVYAWIKTKYEMSQSQSEDVESMTDEVETFEFLYRFVKKNPTYQDPDFNKLVERVNGHCKALNRELTFSI